MKKVLVFIFLTFLSATSYSQTDFWTQTNGPFGGTVFDYSFGETNVVYTATDDGVYKSTDNGLTWSHLGLAGQNTLGICKLTNGVILAGTYRTTDEGLNWVHTNIPLNVNDIKEINLNVIIAATSAGIYKSTDNGINWTQTLSNVTGFSIDTSSNQEIYISAHEGIYKSIDFGNNWIRVNGFTHTNVRSVDIAINGYIFATTWNGSLYRSTDNGVSFFDISTGASLYKTSRAVATSDGYLYCGTFYQGIWKSTDYGDTWIKQYPGERYNFFVINLREGFNGDIFAAVAYNGIVRTTNHGTNWNGFRFRSVFRRVDLLMGSSDGRIFSNTGHITSDNGQNWIYPDFDFEPSSFARNSTNGELYATDGSTNNSEVSGVYKSTNNGDSWGFINFNNLGFWMSNVYVAGNQDVYASGIGLLKSSNNGLNWTLLSDLSIHALTVNDSGYVFVNLFSGINRSKNSGKTWDLVLPLSTFSSVIYLSKSNYLYVSGNTTLFKSTNNVDNWIQENITGNVTSITENQSGRIFFSLYGAGVFALDNDSVIDLTHDIGNRNVNTLCFNSLGQLLAGTTTGVYKTNPSVISINNLNSNIPNKYFLHQNFPNPFNPKTIISYQLSMFNDVILKVYDVNGKEVAILVNEKQNAGNYSVSFDGGNLSSGIYFYKLTTENFTETKRMMLLK